MMVYDGLCVPDSLQQPKIAITYLWILSKWGEPNIDFIRCSRSQNRIVGHWPCLLFFSRTVAPRIWRIIYRGNVDDNDDDGDDDSDDDDDYYYSCYHCQ